MEKHQTYHENNCIKILVNNVSNAYDCTTASDIQGLSCALESMFNGSINHVLIPFLLIKGPNNESDYQQNDDNYQFFENFKRDDLRFNKLKKNLVIYDASFDLSTLPMHTTEGITESVVIRADTVYMTKLVEISYNLTIRTRVASLSHHILMKIDKKQPNILKMKPLSKVLIKYHYSALAMRHLSFGLVDLFDRPFHFHESKCSPVIKEAVNYTNPSWYDSTYVDLMYVYARSLVLRNQSKTANTIANEILHLYANPKVVKNDQAFIAAKKFEKFRDNFGNDRKKMHQIPKYSMEVFEELCNIMYSNLKDRSDHVLKEEINLQDLQNRLADLNVQFGILESAHDLYFKTESSIIEELVRAINGDNLNTIFQSKLRYCFLSNKIIISIHVLQILHNIQH